MPRQHLLVTAGAFLRFRCVDMLCFKHKRKNRKPAKPTHCAETGRGGSGLDYAKYGFLNLFATGSTSVAFMRLSTSKKIDTPKCIDLCYLFLRTYRYANNGCFAILEVVDTNDF